MAVLDSKPDGVKDTAVRKSRSIFFALRRWKVAAAPGRAFLDPKRGSSGGSPGGPEGAAGPPERKSKHTWCIWRVQVDMFRLAPTKSRS